MMDDNDGFKGWKLLKILLEAVKTFQPFNQNFIHSLTFPFSFQTV
jgi:hypothetical protein